MKINLYNGDCLEVMKDIPDESIDMILCDLPYGVSACKWDTIISLEKLWEEYKRIIKKNSAIVLFGTEPFSSKVRTSNLEMYKYDWIWEKQRPSNFQLMNYQCGRIHENIMIFSYGYASYVKGKDKMKYFPQKELLEKEKNRIVKIYNNKNNFLNDYKNGEKGIKKTYKYKMPTSILKFNTESKKFHPTQKPIALLEYLIKTYTNEGDIVLDNCMGSGSTGVACINTNRAFVGIELDENYFNIAKERIESYLKNCNLE